MAWREHRREIEALQAIGGDTRFDERRLQFDRELNALLVWVGQADYYVSSSPNEVMTTVLGSCVAVCMCDPVIGYGGMNHFVLPEETNAANGLPSVSLRYGSYSIERMFNTLISKGAKRERLQIKVFGGANVMSGNSNIGHANANFVEAYLAKEGLKIKSHHLRGNQARKVRFFPTTGRVQLTLLGSDAASTVLRSEDLLQKNKELVRDHGTVEIFD